MWRATRSTSRLSWPGSGDASGALCGAHGRWLAELPAGGWGLTVRRGRRTIFETKCGGGVEAPLKTKEISALAATRTFANDRAPSSWPVIFENRSRRVKVAAANKGLVGQEIGPFRKSPSSVRRQPHFRNSIVAAIHTFQMASVAVVGAWGRWEGLWRLTFSKPRPPAAKPLIPRHNAVFTGPAPTAKLFC